GSTPAKATSPSTALRFVWPSARCRAERLGLPGQVDLAADLDLEQARLVALEDGFELAETLAAFALHLQTELARAGLDVANVRQLPLAPLKIEVLPLLRAEELPFEHEFLVDPHS